MSSQTADIVVIGGGTVGAAVAYGLARGGASVIVLDGGDGDLRAARVNFGLIWVQSKGLGFPEYQAWSRASAHHWRTFAPELEEMTGNGVQHRQDGGVHFCVGDAEFEQRKARLMRLHNQMSAGEFTARMIDRQELLALMPGVALGPKVVGATYCSDDGDCDPLRLLRALHGAATKRGARILPDHVVRAVVPMSQGFRVETACGTFSADKVVLAAGLGSVPLAVSLGLTAPLRPERGQILVTERLAAMALPTATDIRQSGNGTVLIGATNDDVGFNVDASADAAATLAARATRILPALANVRLVRTWSGLRILSPDNAPIYQQSEMHPGAFLITCHSGVTLAAVHAGEIARGVLDGALPGSARPFHPSRFQQGQGQGHVRAVA
jgi:glycine/D-amino acid oxidase-like deaminating enzyme